MYPDKTIYQTNLDLSLYIEDLLHPIHVQVESKTRTEEKIETILLNDLVTPEIVEQAVKIESEQFIAKESIETKPKQEVLNSTIPEWGKQPFQCLNVKIDNKNLIIPAMSVSYIERISKKIIRLPIEAEAFRGVVVLRNRSIAVIDLYNLISGNGISCDQNDKNVEQYHVEYVIVMEDGNYALACDEIGEMTELYPEDVRWNKASFNNPLFAGIVPDKLSVIINIAAVQKQITTMPFVQSLNSKYINN